MDIKSFFAAAMKKGAADLHLVGGSVPALRINEQLIKIDGDQPLDGK